MKDVIIIGAGPAGSSCAKKIAEAGYDVTIYEKRAEIGSPCRCAEGIDKKGEDLIGEIPKKCIAQKVKGARLYSPNGKYFEIVVEGGGYVLERKVFDKWLANEAVKAGAEVRANTDITDLIIENNSVKGVKGEFIGEKFEEKASVVVAAVGGDSPLPKKAGINTTSSLKLIDTCVQYEMANVKSNQDFIHIHLGNKLAPRGYCWVFPKGNRTANVGVGIVPSEKTPKFYLEQFINSSSELKGASILEVNAGSVPVGGLIKDMVSNGFLVCGEAAHHVNPIHGGGIKEAIISGQIAADVIIDCLKKGDTSKKSLSSFNNLWWKKRGKGLTRVEKMREVMENLTDGDMNSIGKAIKPEDVVNFAEGKRSITMARILMRNPRLIKFAKHLV